MPYLVNGNSGKTPSAPAAEGGFTGWSLVGVDQVSRGERSAARDKPWKGGPDWVSVQTRAHTDALMLDAPAVLTPGHGARVTATVTQGERKVPVGFPLSADWTGSPNLRIGGGPAAANRHTAVYDPASGTLTALRTGTVTLAVTVNGVTSQARIRIAAPSSGAAAPAA